MAPESTSATMWPFFSRIWGSFAARSSSHARAASSPSMTLIAVMNDWNEALVGAQPMRPFHCGSVKPVMDVGRSAGESSRVS